MQQQININTDNFFLAASIVKKIESLQELFETPKDFEKFLEILPSLQSNFLVQNSLKGSGINLKKA